MRLSKSLTLTCLSLVIMTLTACVSQGNHARQEVNSICSQLEIPSLAIAYEKDIMTYRGNSYVLAERYIWSQTHSKTLSQCVTALSCSLQWSDYQHECDMQRSFWREAILGRSKCDAVKPSC